MEAQTLIAVVNGNFSGFVFPHQHATLGRRPVLTLPFQWQPPILVVHHPVLTHHSFILQPKRYSGKRYRSGEMAEGET